MKIETIGVWGIDGAMHGMRNPKESWTKNDTVNQNIGPNDMKLALTLHKAGPEHRKYLRMIHVQADITAPLYFWSEFDTYKISTVANSTSKMHKIHSKPITIDCFETDDYCNDYGPGHLNEFIAKLEELRSLYVLTGDKRYWKELIRWLPESWLQTRTVDLNYETIRSMCSPGQRRHHKLTEWSKTFIEWARTLPHAQELIFTDELEKE